MGHPNSLLPNSFFKLGGFAFVIDISDGSLWDTLEDLFWLPDLLFAVSFNYLV